MEALWFAVASGAVSVVTLILLALQLRFSVHRSVIDDLEHRIKRLEEEVKVCEADRKRLMDENIELMRRLSGIS